RLPKEEVSPLLPKDTLHLARMFPVLWRVRAIREGSHGTLEARDPQEHRLRAFGALRALFARLAEARPVSVHIDALQWGDLDSAHLLADVFRAPDPPPIMLVACHRSEDVDTSAPLKAMLGAGEGAGPAEVREIAVEALGEREAGELVDVLSEAQLGEA